jgi:hypothetical protein
MKQLGFDGTETEPEEKQASKHIEKLCINPAHTRRAAEKGRPVPCYRCMAFGEDNICHFLRDKPSPKRRRSPHV